MFERMTDRARRIVVLSQEEARMLNHDYIGTEHLLLGMVHEGEGVAAQALQSLGISLDAVRSQVEEIIGQGPQAPSGHIPFTPRAKKVLELSLRESLQLGHNYIGTEHLLLGLIREGDGVAALILVKLGAELTRVRQQVIQILHGLGAPAEPMTGEPSVKQVQQAVPWIPESGKLSDLSTAMQNDLAEYRVLDAATRGLHQAFALSHSLSDGAFEQLKAHLRYQITDIFTNRSVHYALKWEGDKLVGIDWSSGS